MFLFSIAYVHVNVNHAEHDVLLQFADAFGITTWDRVSLEYKFGYRTRFDWNPKDGGKGKKGPRKRRDEKKSKSAKEKRKGGEAPKKESVPSDPIVSTRISQAYDVLGLPDKSNEVEVKKAYHSLVKQCHPDIFPENVSDATKEKALIRFREIHEAYEFLNEVLCEVEK